MARGCSSPDWGRVLATPGCSLEGLECARLAGDVVLDLMPGSAVSSSLVEDSILRGRTRIAGTGLVRGCEVVDSTIEGCGRITFEDPTAVSTGPLLRLGVETGERDLRGHPMLDLGTAEGMTSGAASPELRREFSRAAEEHRSAVRGLRRGLIGPGAVLRTVPAVCDSLVGGGCTVDNACCVRGSILLGVPGEGASVLDGAVVRSSILQWSSRADSGAVAEESLVCEGAVVEHNALLSGSLLGPCSVQGGGEVIASLVGPLTMMHHQSLLIAARWPGGCGNLGYGANVGSNHTSRLPDQEVAIGTGVFLGLSCSVKLPCDLSGAHGSVVATSTVLGPGRASLPYSLIAPSADGARLVPGWVVRSDLFALLRTELKLRARWRASRHPVPEGPLGPSALEAAIRAEEALEAGRIRASELDFAVLPEDAAAGLESYRFLLDWLGLRMLEGRPVGAGGSSAALGGRTASRFGSMDAARRRGLLAELDERAVRMIRSCRERDHERGVVIPGYSALHSPPEADEALAAVLAIVTG